MKSGGEEMGIEVKKKERTRTFLPTLLGLWSLSLTGCMGVYEGGFDCPPGKGVGCKSISEVHRMVEEGELPQKEKKNSSGERKEGSCKSCGEENTEKEGQIWYAPILWSGGR